MVAGLILFGMQLSCWASCSLLSGAGTCCDCLSWADGLILWLCFCVQLPLQVVAACKHFLGYSLEGAEGISR